MARQDNDADAQRLQRLRTGPSGVAVGEGEIDDREIGVEFGRAAERFLRIVKHPANHVASLHDDRGEVGGEQRFIFANQGSMHFRSSFAAAANAETYTRAP